MAIKVIDKLRFPTKQEAQLKNEVSKLKKKVSLDISFEEINDALKEKKDYKKYDGDLP